MKKKQTFSWLNVPFSSHILKSEMFIKKSNLDLFSDNTFPKSFEDERVSIEEMKSYFESKAFDFLTEK